MIWLKRGIFAVGLCVVIALMLVGAVEMANRIALSAEIRPVVADVLQEQYVAAARAGERNRR